MRLISLLFLFVALPVCGATFYVTQSGSGANNGSSLADSWNIGKMSASSNWSTTPTAGKVSPGDLVLIYGNVTNLICAGSGTFANPVSIEYSNAVAWGSVQFNGRDNFQLLNVTTATNLNFSDPFVRFGTSSGNVSTNILVSTLRCIGKVSDSVIGIGYVRDLIITNCTITGFSGNAVEGIAAPMDRITIVNNVIESRAGTSGETTDLIKLAWAEEVTIQGNRLILQTGKSANDPHNDIIQCWKHDTDEALKPRDWTVRNNWFEIRDITKTGGSAAAGFSNFAMLQYMIGTFLFEGNVFYCHNLNSQVGNGVNVSRHMNYPETLTIKFHNNTLVSRDNGLANLITCLADGGGSSPASNRLEIINNAFYRDDTDDQPIVQSVSTTPSSTMVMSNNVFYGWIDAVRNCEYTNSNHFSYTDFNATFGLGGRLLTFGESSQLFANVVDGDFTLTASSVAKNNALGMNPVSVISETLTSAAFPNPSVSVGLVSDIGANSGSSIVPGGPGRLTITSGRFTSLTTTLQ